MVECTGSPSFDVPDWRDLVDLYPDQWVAVQIEQVTAGAGFTRGKIIAAGKQERPVTAALDTFIAANPDKEFALLHTGAMIRRGQDLILAGA